MRKTLILALVLSGCGSGLAPASKTAKVTAPAYDFYVVQFIPPTSTQPVLPSTVTVVFNTAGLNRAALSALTHYNLQCGADIYAAQAVDSLSGYASVTVTLPAVSNAGSCTFLVSSAITDDTGRALEGVRSAVYTISP